MVDYINSVRKYVVSTTLEEPLGWNNSTLIGGDIAREINTLKEQPGKNITITGRDPMLVQWLIRAGLLDQLQTHGASRGSGPGEASLRGRRRARGFWSSPSSKSFGTGVVSLAYRPSGERGFLMEGTRKLIVCNAVSLDGYYEGPGKDVMSTVRLSSGLTRRTRASTPTTPSGCARPTHCSSVVPRTTGSRDSGRRWRMTLKPGHSRGRYRGSTTP